MTRGRALRRRRIFEHGERAATRRRARVVPTARARRRRHRRGVSSRRSSRRGGRARGAAPRRAAHAFAADAAPRRARGAGDEEAGWRTRRRRRREASAAAGWRTRASTRGVRTASSASRRRCGARPIAADARGPRSGRRTCEMRALQRRGGAEWASRDGRARRLLLRRANRAPFRRRLRRALVELRRESHTRVRRRLARLDDGSGSPRRRVGRVDAHLGRAAFAPPRAPNQTFSRFGAPLKQAARATRRGRRPRGTPWAPRRILQRGSGPASSNPPGQFVKARCTFASSTHAAAAARASADTQNARARVTAAEAGPGVVGDPRSVAAKRPRAPHRASRRRGPSARRRPRRRPKKNGRVSSRRIRACSSSPRGRGPPRPVGRERRREVQWLTPARASIPRRLRPCRSQNAPPSLGSVASHARKTRSRGTRSPNLFSAADATASSAFFSHLIPPAYTRRRRASPRSRRRSPTHPRRLASTIARASPGSAGTRAISRPVAVAAPRASIAPTT